jgi:hypothetical protein
MNIPTTDALRGVESLLGNIGELMLDAEGVARDGGHTELATQVNWLAHSITSLHSDVRTQITQIEAATHR